MLSIADNFGLITEEALRIKLERIKNEAEGFLSVRTPRAVYELAYDVASKLIDDFDSNKNRYLYQIDLDGKPYYALSETAYQEAKNAIKQVRAIGIKTEISKLAYLDFHFWLSPGEWSSDESDFRVSLMETLSKIKGDPMFSLVIDFSKEEHPVLFVIKTNALGRIKLVKQVNAQNGLFIASINKAYHYRILKTKYSGQLSVQCYNRDVDLSVLPQL